MKTQRLWKSMIRQFSLLNVQMVTMKAGFQINALKWNIVLVKWIFQNRDPNQASAERARSRRSPFSSFLFHRRELVPCSGRACAKKNYGRARSLSFLFREYQLVRCSRRSSFLVVRRIKKGRSLF